ncbi:MAG TPA: hypothetical protein VEL12_04475 [Candidatus Nitrosopolaris sp.]|nr:hypothetical protein [Candidatus Nitrosopolaris sp.]
MPEYVDLPIYHEELASALGFGPSDLDANRAGTLSASQRSALLGSEARRMVASGVSLLIALGFVAAAIAIGVTTGLSVRILVFAAVALFVAGLLAFSSIKLWRDISAGDVLSVQGFVNPGMKIKPVGRYTVPDFYWDVGDQRFHIPGNAYGVLTPAPHRLYFLPLTRRIVSAEPISG